MLFDGFQYEICICVSALARFLKEKTKSMYGASDFAYGLVVLFGTFERGTRIRELNFILFW